MLRMTNPISYAFFVAFVGLFLRDWYFMSDVKTWPSYRSIAKQPVIEPGGKVSTATGAYAEEVIRKWDSLGAIKRIGEHNFTTSGIALLLSAALALIGSFLP